MTASRFTVPQDVLASRVGSETVILHLQSGLYFGLNEVGAEIWQLLQEGRSVSEIADHVVDTFDAARPTVEADLHDLIASLIANGLLLPATD